MMSSFYWWIDPTSYFYCSIVAALVVIANDLSESLEGYDINSTSYQNESYIIGN